MGCTSSTEVDPTPNIHASDNPNDSSESSEKQNLMKHHKKKKLEPERKHRLMSLTNAVDDTMAAVTVASSLESPSPNQHGPEKKASKYLNEDENFKVVQKELYEKRHKP